MQTETKLEGTANGRSVMVERTEEKKRKKKKATRKKTYIIRNEERGVGSPRKIFVRTLSSSEKVPPGSKYKLTFFRFSKTIRP